MQQTVGYTGMIGRKIGREGGSEMHRQKMKERGSYRQRQKVRMRERARG